MSLDATESAVPRPAAPLAGRAALVTGGGSGIGRAVAIALARAGARVAVAGRSFERLRETVEEIERLPGGADALRAVPLVADVRSEDQTAAMAKAAVERLGSIDILVASAGIGRADATGRSALPTPLHRLSPAHWNDVIDTNLKGIFLTDREVLPYMLERGRGEIVHIGSARGGLKGQPYAAAYCASKFGVIGLSEALRAEVGPLGVRVQVVLPEAVASPLLAKTTLGSGPRASLPADRLAALVVRLVTLPADAAIDRPLIAPFGGPPRRAAGDRRGDVAGDPGADLAAGTNS